VLRTLHGEQVLRLVEGGYGNGHVGGVIHAGTLAVAAARVASGGAGLLWIWSDEYPGVVAVGGEAWTPLTSGAA
jgi:hypothetical protein